jgi:hypothetical protein
MPVGAAPAAAGARTVVGGARALDDNIRARIARTSLCA